MPNDGAPIVERNWMLPYGATFGAITTIIVGLRIYSRLPGQLGLDDFFIVLGWMFGVATIALTIWSKIPDPCDAVDANPLLPQYVKVMVSTGMFGMYQLNYGGWDLK